MRGDYQDEFNVAMIASLSLSFSGPLIQEVSPLSSNLYELELYFDWRNTEPGEFSLICEILTPTQLVDYENSNAFGGGEI